MIFSFSLRHLDIPKVFNIDPSFFMHLALEGFQSKIAFLRIETRLGLQISFMPDGI